MRNVELDAAPAEGPAPVLQADTTSPAATSPAASPTPRPRFARSRITAPPGG
jgi:hypothetical protein